MRKIFFAVGIAVFFILPSKAQTIPNFEGIITYSISFENSGLPPEILSTLKGSESITYIKGYKRRVDLNTPVQNTSTFIDDKTGLIVASMDLGDKKYLIKMTDADLKSEKEMAPETSIEYIDSTKQLAGYTCKEAKVKLKNKDGNEETVVVYYTTQIPVDKMKEVFTGLKGFPLEYSITQGGIKMTFTTKSISKESVPDAKLNVPKEGYILTTMEELKKTMGQ
jgi:GLPGLI family protein